MFAYIKQYYEEKLYTIDDLAVFISSGMLTAEQYKELTGKDYTV